MHDPVAGVGDEKVYLSKQLARRSQEKPGVVSRRAMSMLIGSTQISALVQQAQAAETETVRGFVQYMTGNG